MLAEWKRKEVEQRLRQFGVTYDEMKRLSYDELKKQLAIKQLTDGELKTREQWF